MRAIGTVLFLCLYVSVFSQGKLLLIGGGTEYDTENSWNAEAYAWAIEESATKKVAILTFDDSPSSWLPDYFTEECGAVSAKNFSVLSETEANTQSLYDEFKTYDVVFIKGGDQYSYYANYKNTKLSQAIQEIYNEGGVICGTSAGCAVLSTVVFTAKNGSAYPNETIENIQDSYITLEDDFLNLFDGYVFDTHFAERGRFGRLVSFLANWNHKTGETISGIGIDDMTAMAIDENGIGTVYGTGAANFYIPTENSFTGSNMLLAENVKVFQLNQGASYNFNSKTIEGIEENANVEFFQEDGIHHIVASGGNSVSDNAAMLEYFAKNMGDADGNIAILTGYDKSLAESYKTKLGEFTNAQINILSMVITNASSDEYKRIIENTDKFLFVDNSPGELIGFLSADNNGELLKSTIYGNDVALAFVGDDSRMLGKTVIGNYTESSSSYYGEISFTEGLGILKTFTIQPNTFMNSDVYENTATSVPYAMVTNSLAHGVWLNQKNFLEYYIVNETAYIKGHGNSPILVLKNNNSNYSVSQQTSRGDAGQNPRMVAGFDNMEFYSLNGEVQLVVGENIVASSQQLKQINNLQVYPNPVRNRAFVQGLSKPGTVDIYSMHGVKVLSELVTPNQVLELAHLAPGNYIISISTETTVFSQQLIIQ